MAFVSEKESVAIGVFNIPIRVFGLGGKEPEPLGSVGTRAKGFPVFVMMDIEVVPIVHPAAADLFIRNLKSEGIDEVESALGDGAKATDVTGVLGDFGIEENEVQHGRG